MSGYNLRSRKVPVDGSEMSTCESTSTCKSEDPGMKDLIDTIRQRQQHMDDLFDQDYLHIDSDGWDDFMASDYLQGGWVEDVDADEDTLEYLQEQLQEIIDEMRKESPNVQKILESDLTHDEKKGALYKLDVLKNMETSDPEYGKLRRDIMKKLESRHPLVQKYLADKKRTWEERIMELEATEKIKGHLIVLANQLGDVDDAEYRARFNKLEMLIKLPYDRVIRPKSDGCKLDEFLTKASKILDNELYKMDSVKKKILGVMATYIRTGVQHGCVIGLVGDPGVGKTHISRVIAKCLGFPFQQITLGSSDDLATLLGSDNTWVGSSCGDLASAYMKMGHSNGVICIDELDKSGKKIWNAINHIIDPETNHDIKDAYLRDVPIDCSRTIFILSLNSKEALPKYLASRIIMVPVPSQSLDDKMVITKRYKIPRMSIPDGITFADDAIKALVSLSDQKGYREINAYLKHVVESLNMHIIMQNQLKTFKHCPLKDFKLPFVVKREHIQTLTKELKGTSPPNLYI